MERAPKSLSRWASDLWCVARRLQQGLRSFLPSPYFFTWLTHTYLPSGLRWAVTFFRKVSLILKCITFLIYLFIFRERGNEGERERNINVWEKQLSAAPRTPPTRAHNPGMCPSQELNYWPFGLQNGNQPTEPYQSGHIPLLRAPTTLCTLPNAHKLPWWWDLPKTFIKHPDSLEIQIQWV